jgi:hypothetical protein
MAERDILARFETPGRAPAPEAAQQSAEGGLPEYLAFETEDKLITLDIIRATAPCRCPLLRNYLDIAYTPKLYSGFTLFFTYMTVKVHGENLRDVVTGFRFGKCTCIREYHPSLYRPPEPGKPLIEKIELVIRPLHEALTESEQVSE